MLWQRMFAVEGQLGGQCCIVGIAGRGTHLGFLITLLLSVGGRQGIWACGVAGSKDGLRTNIFDDDFDMVAGGE